MTIEQIFTLIIVIFSVIIHEVAHGYAASFFGDHTAKYQGRLTLNPFKHIDIFGSVLLPILLLLSNSGIMFGWAKPVPYNPHNLRHPKIAEPIIAFSGPLSNMILALIFSLLLRIMIAFNCCTPEFAVMIHNIVLTNIVLGIFNLIPIPPLDGSRIISFILPSFVRRLFHKIEWYGMIIVLVVVTYFGQQMSNIAEYITRFFLGQ